jgi:hypothetical protein
VRRLLSILLLLVFGLPLASPLLAQSDASLPACCRRAGKHHCMSMMDESTGTTDHRHVSVVQEKCAYCPAVLSISNSPAMGLPVVLLLPALQGQSAIVMQAKTSQRIAQERARHKRGPPSSLPL